MKHLSRAIIAVFMAIIMGTLFPAQVFADTPDYISEVKVFAGSYADAEKEGYTILKDGDNAVDLNQKAGATGIGSKGEKAIYLGYKTTADRGEAITDLALMNMKGGYSVEDYEVLMETQMKEQIVPFVESFIVALNEYRANYTSDDKGNRQRAEYIHNALNKLTDDDCDGKGLGDLLLNKTKFEMGDDAYNKLSDEEKKNHADILTLLAQANGQATLLIENFIVRACDTESTNWLERFVATSYDDLVDETGLSPSKAAKQLAKQYDDDAATLLEMWDAFREQLLGADEFKDKLDVFTPDDMKENAEVFKNFDLPTADDNDITDLANASVETEMGTELLANRLNDVIAKEYLESMEYEDGTLFDFFTQESEDIEDDITVLYPLVASLSDGQRAGLDMITLSDLVVIAGTEPGNYSDEIIEKLEPTSVYEGVDRGIYQKGGVALTSDALRQNAAQLSLGANDSSFPIKWWTFLMGATALASSIAFGVSLGSKLSVMKTIATLERSKAIAQELITSTQDIVKNFAKNGTKWIRVEKTLTFAEYNQIYKKLEWKIQDAALKSAKEHVSATGKQIERLSARSSTCNKLMLGFGIAVIIFTAITVYLSYRDLAARYQTDFTPIPLYMIDEKDLIGYNSKGEKVILKNQSAYYKAVTCNRAKNAEYYGTLGEIADMNGDVGKQWLALYAASNESELPILASSLKAVVNSEEIPAGYTTGIHMFGNSAAENLNNTLYDWNSKAPKVYVYFKVDESANNTAGSNFTTGTLALTGGAGIILGAVVTALGMKKSGKRKENTTVTA